MAKHWLTNQGEILKYKTLREEEIMTNIFNQALFATFQLQIKRQGNSRLNRELKQRRRQRQRKRHLKK